jgi:hypothetical protein
MEAGFSEKVWPCAKSHLAAAQRHDANGLLNAALRWRRETMPGQSPLSMMRPPSQRVQKPGVRLAPRRRWRIIAAVVIVIVLAVLWVGLWYYAAAVTDRTLAGWMEREAAAGRVYSCGTQSIAGFPWRIEARCTDAAVEIRNQLPPYAVKATAVSFAAEVWHPTRLIGDVTGPVALAELGQPPLAVADWTHARLTVRGIPPDPDSVSFQLDGPHLDRVGGDGATIFEAKHADIRGTLAAGSPNDHPVIAVTMHLVGAKAPTLHPLLAQPIDAELNGELRGFKDLSPKPWADRFREMQANGGGVEIKSLHITQGASLVVGAGTLSVNAQGKLDGVVHVAIVGIEHVLPLLAVDQLIAQGVDRLAGRSGSAAQGAAALDRLIPGLSGTLRQSASASLIENLKKMGQPSSINGQPAIVLPLRFNDGAIYLGMLRVGEVPPLF